MNDKTIAAYSERDPVPGHHHGRIDHAALGTAKARVAPLGLDHLDELENIYRQGDFLGQGGLRPVDCGIARHSLTFHNHH